MGTDFGVLCQPLVPNYFVLWQVLDQHGPSFLVDKLTGLLVLWQP